LKRYSRLALLSWGPVDSWISATGTAANDITWAFFFTLQVTCFGLSSITQDWYTATAVQLGKPPGDFRSEPVVVYIDDRQDTDKTVSMSFDYVVLTADGIASRIVLDSERDPCPRCQHH